MHITQWDEHLRLTLSNVFTIQRFWKIHQIAVIRILVLGLSSMSIALFLWNWTYEEIFMYQTHWLICEWDFSYKPFIVSYMFSPLSGYMNYLGSYTTNFPIGYLQSAYFTRANIRTLTAETTGHRFGQAHRSAGRIAQNEGRPML